MEIERLKILEARVSAVKTDVYRPMIDALNEVLGGQKVHLEQSSSKGQRRAAPRADLAETTRVFAGWLSIIGSDEAVRAFRNLMQAAYSGAPGQIFLRLYAEFVVAARRDMGDPDTRIGIEEVLGIRITDLYSDADMRKILQGSIADVASAFAWTVPWNTAPPNAT